MMEQFIFGMLTYFTGNPVHNPLDEDQAERYQRYDLCDCNKEHLH
jgi:UDP-N-acetylglucosamine:LPS N-acetylglucosamine transferase